MMGKNWQNQTKTDGKKSIRNSENSKKKKMIAKNGEK